MDNLVSLKHLDRIVRDVHLDSAFAHVARLPAPHFHVGEDRHALARPAGRKRFTDGVGATGRSAFLAPARPLGFRLDARIDGDVAHRLLGGGVDIEIDRRSARPLFGSRRRLGETLQRVAQRAIAFLRRVKFGEPAPGSGAKAVSASATPGSTTFRSAETR